MEKLTASIPEDCREIWNKMTNFNFTKASDPNMRAEINEYKEHKMMPTFGAEGVKYAYEDWLPREGDVLVASYPRTGTNWTTEIVRNILYGRDNEMMEMSSALPIQLMLHEGGGPDKFKILDNIPFPRRYSATHLPAALINVNSYKKANAKIICVIRNPKDQAYSWFKLLPHLPNFMLEPVKTLANLPWDEFLEQYTSGNIPSGMKEGQWYLDHILTWLPHRDSKNVLFICFEDMKKELHIEVRRLADFLDVKLSDEEIVVIADKCGFKEMKKTTEKGASDMTKIRKDINVLRKGMVGDWKNHFTVAQSEAIDVLVDEKLKSTDITFTYEI